MMMMMIGLYVFHRVTKTQQLHCAESRTRGDVNNNVYSPASMHVLQILSDNANSVEL